LGFSIGFLFVERQQIIEVEGGITAPKGIRAAGVCCGIKAEKLDLALVTSDRPALVGGVFTTNLVKAAPVLLCQERLKGRWLSALVVNSGNANACTGRRGLEDSKATARFAAKCLGCSPEEVFVASTGIIGHPLPMSRLREGIKIAATRLSPYGGREAALAIMTTDTFPKEAAVTFQWGGKRVTLGGMAKGAGMIAPKMATMLCFLATDGSLEISSLQRALRRSVERSFNRITVDGCMSTNDMVLLFANGASVAPPLKGLGFRLFQQALDRVTACLARMIVKDGEGATKLVEVKVKGAKSARAAEQAARAVADSLLVKTALFGEDCNWGRIMAALGASGVNLQVEAIDLFLDEVQVVRGGMGLGKRRERLAQERMKRPEFALTIDLHRGRGEAQLLTTDLSEEYVRVNAAYRT